MPKTNATGLIMPRVVAGDQDRRPAGYANIVGWPVASDGSTALAQPGAPEDDTTLTQPELLDDEMFGSVEVGIIVVPHFPREAERRRPGTGLSESFSTSPRYGYTMSNAKYWQRALPAPLDDTAIGLPDPLDDEMFSVSASDSERRNHQSATQATKAKAAHQANLIMSDSETTETGATGVWSVAGRN